MTDAERRTGRWPWLLGVILLAAAVLRLYALGREGLWCDEAYTALTIRLPLREMIARLVRTDDAPPLFYMLQKLGTALTGDSEAGLRAAPALAGILTVATLLWLAVRRHAAADAWSAGFMAIATYGVFHARQARSYAQLLLLAMVLVLSAREMLLGRRRAGPLLALSGSLLCLTHHVAIVLVLSSLVLWPWGAPARPRLRSWVLWHAPPLAIWVFYWIAARSQLAVHLLLNPWTAQYWQTHPMGLAPIYSLGVFVPGGLPASAVGAGFPTLGRGSVVWTVISAALGLVCLLSAARGTRGPWGAPPDAERREVALEAAFLFLPLLGLLAASRVITPVYILTRTDVFAFPAFVLLIGRGLACLPRRAAGGILFFWLLVALISLTPSYGLGNAARAKGNDRRVAREMVADGLARGDWVVHTFYTAPSVEYYLGRLDAPHRTAWFPKVGENNPASAWPTPLDSLPAYLGEAAELRRALEDSLPEDGVVWIFGLIEESMAETIRRGRAPQTLSVEQIGYPVSALVYSLVGTRPVRAVCVYDQDWISGLRVLLWVPRASWVPLETLPRIEVGAVNDG
jgi:4-amino-4-deoxy-L-arabinose transferase-like glycosyltransferase